MVYCTVAQPVIFSATELVRKKVCKSPLVFSLSHLTAPIVEGMEWLHEQASSSEGAGLAACLPRSVLLVGGRGGGKTVALHAICKDTGALLMDLTATNIVGRYPGRTGLAMLLHIVLKV